MFRFITSKLVKIVLISDPFLESYLIFGQFKFFNLRSRRNRIVLNHLIKMISFFHAFKLILIVLAAYVGYPELKLYLIEIYMFDETYQKSLDVAMSILILGVYFGFSIQPPLCLCLVAFYWSSWFPTFWSLPRIRLLFELFFLPWWLLLTWPFFRYSSAMIDSRNRWTKKITKFKQRVNFVSLFRSRHWRTASTSFNHFLSQQKPKFCSTIFFW